MPKPNDEIPILPAAGTPPEPEPPPPAPPQRGPSPRQTFGYLRGLLQDHGLEPKAKLGQKAHAAAAE